MQRPFRIVTTMALLGFAAGPHAHENPAAHASGIAPWLPHSHGVLEGFAVMLLIVGVCSLLLVALKQIREARWQRARRAVPVVIIRPGLRVFRAR